MLAFCVGKRDNYFALGGTAQRKLNRRTEMNMERFNTAVIQGHAFVLRGFLNYKGNLRELNTKPRVYVSLPEGMLPSDSALDALASKLGATSKYTRRGEFPELDKAWDAHNRAIIKAERDVLMPLLKGTQFEGKASFSRKAGCSCGCSPGFILENGRRGFQLWVEKLK
jgi:hypothetical protein